MPSVIAGIGILELAQVVPASEICGPYLKTPSVSESRILTYDLFLVTVVLEVDLGGILKVVVVG